MSVHLSSQADLARRVGVSKQAVSRDLAQRVPADLVAYVTRRGRRVAMIRDLEAAAQAWQGSKARLSPQESRGERPIGGPEPAPEVDQRPTLLFDGLDEIGRPRGPWVAIGFRLDGFLAGAAQALRETGRAATPEALRAVVGSVSVVDWWCLALNSLDASLEGEVSRGIIARWWPDEGRRAARKLLRKEETVHGQ